MQGLPRLRRREADTTSYVADYLTRSVRRASGFVLVGKQEVIDRATDLEEQQIQLRDPETASGKLVGAVRRSSASAMV